MNTSDSAANKPILKRDSLLNLARKLYTKRKLLRRNTLIGLVLGIIFAIGTHKTWTSTVVLAPEMGTENALGGSLSSLASMAGLHAGATSTDAIYPELYPQMIEATPFLVGLLDVEVETIDGKVKTSLYDYIQNYQERSWSDYPSHWAKTGAKAIASAFIKDDFKESSDTIDPFYLSKDQDRLIESMRNGIVEVFVNKSDQLITISATTQDPLVSAILVDSIRERLQKEITDYRTLKARHDMEYYKELVDKAHDEYKLLEKEYASFSDKHMNPLLTSVKAEQEDLSNRMQLAFSVFTQMAQQYETAKAKVQEATPAFTILQPASVSVKPSSKPKLLVAFIWTFMFFFFTALWILVRDVLREWKQKIKTPAPEADTP